jgi:O-antigen/teichoic acid export membrane protein
MRTRRHIGWRAGTTGELPIAFLDQGIVSAANFLAVALVARATSAPEVGGYVLAVAVGMLFANAQGGIVAQPLAVLGPQQRAPEGFAGHVAVAARMQLLLVGSVCAAGGLLAIALLGLHHAALAAQVACAVPFFAAWQLQEFGRRVQFALQRAGEVLRSDVIAYGGRIGVLATLLGFGHLDANSALLGGAAASAVAVVVAARQLPELRAPAMSWARAWREHWQFGRWLLVAEAIQAASTRLYVYLSAALLGAAATGALAAVSQVASVLNVFMLALMSVLLPRFVRIAASGGDAALHAATVRWTSGTTLGAAVLLAVPFTWPHALLTAAYGPGWGSHAGLLRMQAIAYLAWVPTYVPSISLRVHRRTWAFPAMQLGNVVLTVTLGSWLLRTQGLVGCMIGSSIGAAASIAFLAVVYRRARRSSPIRVPLSRADQVVAGASA